MCLAKRSPPGAHNVLFLPHLAGERSPYLDSEARGAWVNLSLAHSQADTVRAVLEGVAFSLRAALEVMRAITPVHQLLATGGGARSVWLQILADVLNIELIAPKAEEGAAYGAAILAMVGVGVYPNLEATFKLLPPDSKTVQSQSQDSVYEAAFQRYQSLYKALKAVR